MHPSLRFLPMTTTAAPNPALQTQTSHVRWFILALLFLVTTINFADRATLSIAGPAVQKELGIDAAEMGWVFSAFAWAYAAAQIPGGWLLDRFGSKRVYALSILFWSIFTFLQGATGFLTGLNVVVALFTLRLLVGLAEAPSFPGNSRIVSAWFPTAERGTAAATFNSAQYFATVMFAPLMGWVVDHLGWRHVFTMMGGLGIVMAAVWVKFIHSPKDDPRVSPAELRYIEQGGALVDLEQPGKKTRGANAAATWWSLRQLLTNRMLLGVYIAQYCINALTYFFLTWFPIYLVKERGMSILKAGVVASIPALAGFVGGILGGMFSDYLLRTGRSHAAARKIPIVVGMLMSTSMIACNYTSEKWAVVAIMTLAFFGKGVGALGWAVVADTSPKENSGLSGGLFNTFGNVAGITTPIIIGYIVQTTGSFEGALVFVGANAIGAILCYLLVVGKIERVTLKPYPTPVSR